MLLIIVFIFNCVTLRYFKTNLWSFTDFGGVKFEKTIREHIL